MQIRFLHISDIHCGYSNYGVNQMREKLAPQLLKFTQDKGQTIDYLFITGDLKYGPACKEGYPPEALAFVREVQSSFDIKPDHTFVVPGNHDVKRGKMRTAAVNDIKESYQSHVGSISDENLVMLDMTQQEYRQLYQEICGNSCRGNHFFVDLGPVNVIHLNTALICGSDGEDGSLIVGTTMLRDSLNGMDTSKPAIVLAHHSFDCLAQEEQMKLERLLKEKNALMYLCGHKHVNRFQQIASEVKDKPLWEILCGTNMDSAPNIEQTEMSIYVGTLDTNSSCGYIDAYKWSRRNEEWMPDSEFSRRECGSLDGRFYFPNREVNLSTEASNRYLDYLRRTYTHIQLDGLPTDGHAASRRFPLSSLYVPARFCLHETIDSTSEQDHRISEYALQRTSFNAKNIIPFLANNHVVVLAGPGCGKTTYIKKIISDHVSDTCDNGLYPLMIRCRSLNERSDLSIMSILQELPTTAEFPMNAALRQTFCDMVCAKLQLGGILLLIDGLDEITDGRKRSQFIRQLDAFSQTYPQNRILVTSRLAGYDEYTNSNLSEFEVLEIADFSNDDIQTLCVNWHHTVIDNTDETTAKALELAENITDHYGIKALAQNPLLLTTLLLVQRRLGRLPTKRATLYDEAIKVLLETWNQEGHAPLDLDISTCKLAYIAYRMSCKGIKQITRKELLKYLYDARTDVSRKLYYDNISPEDFLMRTEQRSSILIRVGFKTDRKTKQLHEIYEFQHLTFLEYLTAISIRERYYPHAKRSDRYIDILRNPNGLNAFSLKSVKTEIILLTAAMIGWDAEEIALHLIDTMSQDMTEWEHMNYLSLAHLGICLLHDGIEIDKDIQRKLIHHICIIAPRSYKSLYHTIYRDIAADIFIRNIPLLSLNVCLHIAPFWKLSSEDFSLLASKCDNRYFANDFWSKFLMNILPQEPCISAGYLCFLSKYYSLIRSTLRTKNTVYAQELLSRLEEYHSQHPEIEDLSAKHD